MKYEKNEEIEILWIKDYCKKKYYEKVILTNSTDNEIIHDIFTRINNAKNYKNLKNIIRESFNSNSQLKLEQAIRAKRKRFYDAQNQHTKKKSIDLEYAVWRKLSDKSVELGSSLSETIEYLISETNKKTKVSKKFKDIKKDLNHLLNL
ncbi:Ter macrodomain-binding protein MatP [Paraphotobacterium marinum]|uniref:Ter macrodomain-binding protein MatP n=1 Tax=Paraphotobacterium marinum TaxID=1755811 RepID=UPI0039E99380